MGIFWVFSPCGNVFCCVPVCQNAEDDQMTHLYQSMVVFCVHIVFVLYS